jgi:hypothetical protein
MRGLLIFLSLSLFACVAPTPEANGYNVELFFDGVPLGTETPVGSPATIIVRRIEQRGANPEAETPIELVSAACDAVCDVTPLHEDGNAITLEATADHPGSTTLRVRVRSLVDGAEWDDGYPLAFRSAPVVSPSPQIVGTLAR